MWRNMGHKQRTRADIAVYILESCRDIQGTDPVILVPTCVRSIYDALANKNAQMQ